MSDKKIYSNNNFIKIAHEYCLILRKDFPLMLDFSVTKKSRMDLQDCINITWKDLIASTLEYMGKIATLDKIYSLLEGYKKTSSNRDWKAKVRQTLQRYPSIFANVDKGKWKLVS